MSKAPAGGTTVVDGYRTDIDGLRALAVLPVMLYHFSVGLFSGGYVGVDVFFVISGYLITRIIHREIEAGRFSILAFYERRARRILPALFATIAVTAVLGFFILMPDDLRDLGISLVGVVTFSSNILFWRRTDYFAGAVETKPLIHTWSLAVEEQFYILFPIFLMLLARFLPARYFWPTLIAAAISFALSVAALYIDPTGNYYLLPTRAWELMVGSLLAYRRGAPALSPAVREGGALLGIILILGAALVLNDESPFPGYNALWPCLGAALVLGTGHESLAPTRTARILGSWPLRSIGLISYSLYLIHWPLFVFVKYQLLRSPSGIEQIAMCVAAVALAYISWRFVERPFRNRQRISRNLVFVGSTALGILVSILGAATFRQDGFPDRFDLSFETAAGQATTKSTQNCFLLDESWQTWTDDQCLLAQGPKGNILLWGDSHANHYRIVIERERQLSTANIYLYATSGCPPVFGYERRIDPNCKSNNDHVADIIKQYHIDTVVMAGYWWPILRNGALTYDRIAATITRLKDLGVSVKLVGDNPDFSFANPQFLSYRLRKAGFQGAYYLPVRNNNAVNQKLSALVPASDFFDPMRVLCHDAECLAYDKGEMVMVDNAHLSHYGSALVMEKMWPFLRGDK